MSDRLAVHARPASSWGPLAAATLSMVVPGLLLPFLLRAQTSGDLSLSSLAASCAACHGTAGRTVPGSAIPGLAGMRREAFIAAMRAFRDGTRPATIMQQLAKGFDEARIDALAGYFATQSVAHSTPPASAAP